MSCFRGRKNKIRDVPSSSLSPTRGVTRCRPWAKRNKFRCTFCGGKACRHEDWRRQASPAIIGLNSDWITPDIVASQRLSSRLIQSHSLLTQFSELNIAAVFNLQLPGEHPYCGDGIHIDSGFSYRPDELYAGGVAFYNWGWRDMEAPNISEMVNIVQLMSFIIDEGKKVLVHCHAGYGRTGIAIACYLSYANGVSHETAVNMVREKRRKCIQTNKQVKFCMAFSEYLQRIREIFPENRVSLPEFIANQSVLVHGSSRKEDLHTPKLLREVCVKIRKRLGDFTYNPELLAYSFYNTEHTVFSSPFYQAFISSVDLARSYDETLFNSQNQMANIEQRMGVLKHFLNKWDWGLLNDENDIRILIQIVLDWLETNLVVGALSEDSDIEWYYQWLVDANDTAYKPQAMRQYISRHQYHLIKTLCEDLLGKIKGREDYSLCVIRVVLALRQNKQRYGEFFAGRNMSEITIERLNGIDLKVYKILDTFVTYYLDESRGMNLNIGPANLEVHSPNIRITSS